MRASRSTEKLVKFNRWTKDSIKIPKNHESYLWRHQNRSQWRLSKHENLLPNENGLLKPLFRYISNKIWWKARATWFRLSQKTIGRSGNGQEAKNENLEPFLWVWLKFFFSSLKWLHVDLLRARWTLFCLSVNQSRDTIKSIFWYQTAIVTNLEIIKYLVSYVPHLKGLDSWIPKIYISLKSNDPTGNYHIFSFLVVKWSMSTPDIRNYHLIHQIEVNELRIIIKMILAENFHP